jgi:hypothetical protein
MKLTRIERNQVFEAIAQGNLDPAECVYEERSLSDVIRHESGSLLEIQVLALTVDGRDYILQRLVIDGRGLPVMHVPSIEHGKPYIGSYSACRPRVQAGRRHVAGN